MKPATNRAVNGRRGNISRHLPSIVIFFEIMLPLAAERRVSVKLSATAVTAYFRKFKRQPASLKWRFERKAYCFYA